MIDFEIKEYVRLIGSISLPQSYKKHIEEELIRNLSVKKEIPKKYVAAASVVAFLALGTVMAIKGGKNDIGIM